ncbi:hypothetical protein [Nostoc sp.]
MQNTSQQMKAIAVDKFGGPDKLTSHTLIGGLRRGLAICRRF